MHYRAYYIIQPLIHPFRYVALIDLDELITLSSGQLLLPYVRAIDRHRNICSVNFKPRLFVRDSWDPPVEQVSLDSVRDQLSLTRVVQGSSPVPEGHLPKAIVKPDRIQAMFVHHYVGKVGNCSGYYNVPQRDGFFRHFRQKNGWHFYNKTFEWGPYSEQPALENVTEPLVERVKSVLGEIVGLNLKTG